MDNHNDKLLSSGKFSSLPKGGAAEKGNSGPTGSRTDYSKKGATPSAPSVDEKRFNPMHTGKSTFGVGGV